MFTAFGATCKRIQSEIESSGTPACDKEQFWQCEEQILTSSIPSRQRVRPQQRCGLINAVIPGLDNVCVI